MVPVVYTICIAVWEHIEKYSILKKQVYRCVHVYWVVYLLLHSEHLSKVQTYLRNRYAT